MARTARQLVDRALRLIGIPGRGVSLNDGDTAEALMALNDMLASWATKDLTIPALTAETFTLTSGTATYTIATGQTAPHFGSAAPIDIEQAKIKDANSIEYDVELTNLDEWNRISDKTVQGRPFKLYYQRIASSVGLDTGTIELYFTPNAAESLLLWSWKPFAVFTNLSDVMALPGEYARVIAYNLAIDIAPEYNREASKEVVAIAIQTFNSLISQNYVSVDKKVDPALLRRGVRSYNINVD
jgi:hypothetical protein